MSKTSTFLRSKCNEVF